jgi:hypothetical protein
MIRPSEHPTGLAIYFRCSYLAAAIALEKKATAAKLERFPAELNRGFPIVRE